MHRTTMTSYKYSSAILTLEFNGKKSGFIGNWFGVSETALLVTSVKLSYIEPG